MKLRRLHWQTVLIHLLFWVLYIVAEYFANLMHMRTADNPRFFRSLFLSLPLLVVTTYAIAGYAVPRFLYRKRWGLFLLTLVFAAVFVLYGRVKWLELVTYLEAQYFKVPVAKVLANVIRDYAIIALAVCISIIGDYRREQQANIALIRARAEAEIQLLKGQLQPHFLFNSLNNIYSLALSGSALTADSILRLTELLDYLVYRANQDKVPLTKEIQLLHNYIGLEQLRHGEQLQIETDVSIRNEHLQIAPLLLLPFAENCFKHGGPGGDGVFRVDIRLRADARELDFRIANSRKSGGASKKQAGGVGLANIRQRLSLLYPDRHQLDIEEQPDVYRVRLAIQLSDEKNPLLHR